MKQGGPQGVSHGQEWEMDNSKESSQGGAEGKILRTTEGEKRTRKQSNG